MKLVCRVLWPHVVSFQGVCGIIQGSVVVDDACCIVCAGIFNEITTVAFLSWWVSAAMRDISESELHAHSSCPLTFAEPLALPDTTPKLHVAVCTWHLGRHNNPL